MPRRLLQRLVRRYRPASTIMTSITCGVGIVHPVPLGCKETEMLCLPAGSLPSCAAPYPTNTPGSCGDTPPTLQLTRAVTIPGVSARRTSAIIETGMFPLPPIRRQVTRNFTVRGVSEVGATGSPSSCSKATDQDAGVPLGQPVESVHSTTNAAHPGLRVCRRTTKLTCRRG